MKSPYKKNWSGNSNGNNHQNYNGNENNDSYPYNQQMQKPFPQVIQPVMFPHRSLSQQHNVQNRGYNYSNSEFNHRYSYQGSPKLDPPAVPNYPQYVNQKQLPQQQSLPNAPPTPFDYAYGATLLPSHLLMSSPYISTPNKSFFSYQTSPTRVTSYNRGNNNNSLYPPPPILNSPPLSSSANKKNNKHPKRDSDYADQQNNREEFTENLNTSFKISYKVLPKGDDIFQTRSLLFENINNAIALNTFVEKFINYGLIESVYLVPTKQTQNVNYKSILLSFASRSTCLDFYNSVLQKLSEYKTQLDSEDLKLSFVSLHYVKTGDDNSQEINDLEIMSSLQYDISNLGATRSVCIQFQKNINKEVDFFEKYLPFLRPEQNKRYIVESVFVVQNNEKQNEFPKNYAILSFLNISMAAEVLNYIRSNSESLSIANSFFVVFDRTQHAVSNTNRQSMHNILNEAVSASNLTSPTNHSTELEVNDYPLLYDETELEISNKLEKLDIETTIIELDKVDYPNPIIEFRDDCLPNVSVSKDSIFYANPIYQSPQADFINNMMVTAPYMSPHMMNDDYSSDMNDFNIKPQKNRTFHAPITQTLQNQFATSAEVASKMGGGVGNRTIYIGNINPRSRVEDICNVTRGGILQQVKYFKDKGICFVIFIDSQAATQFYANSFIDPIILHNNTLKIGWGDHPGPLPKAIELAVTVGASRNVYVSLPEFAFKDKFINDPAYQEYHNKYSLPSEEKLREDFNRFGEMEQINFLKDGHCCWINFTNIRSAIKLVESVKKENNSYFHEQFNNRYKGLVIGYGKDRCGNVNKSMISNKNSRYYRKIKKPTYNIRLQQLEKERQRTDKQKQFDNKSINLNSLGISTVAEPTPTDQSTFSFENLKLASEEKDEYSNNNSDIYDSDSNSSTDVELIVNSPNITTRSKKKNIVKNLNFGKLPEVNKITLEANGPIAPSTLSRDFYKSNNTQSNSNRLELNKRQLNKKIIPGSDVMSQYLAQVQHSSFMYAANVLNASMEEPEFFDENDLEVANP